MKIRSVLSGKLPKNYNPYKIWVDFSDKFLKPQIDRIKKLEDEKNKKHIHEYNQRDDVKKRKKEYSKSKRGREIQKLWKKKNPVSARISRIKDQTTHKERRRLEQKKYSKRNPEKIFAHNQTHRARLPLDKECTLCKSNKRLERHHPDYSKPLLIITLCKSCHYKIHFGGG